MPYQYHKTFLSNVIFRVDFASVSEGIKNNERKDFFKNKLKDIFPIQKEGELFEGNFSIDVKTNQSNLTKESSPSLEFQTHDQKIKLNISHKNLSIEHLEYPNFATFSEIVCRVISEFSAVFGETDLARTGLRYINQIKTDGLPFENTAYISEHLTQKERMFFDQESQSSLLRSMAECLLTYDDYSVRYVTGYFNSDFPSSIKKNEYIIDIDCYIQENHKFSDIYRRLNQFHDRVILLFEKSINDGLRNRMGRQDV